MHSSQRRHGTDLLLSTNCRINTDLIIVVVIIILSSNSTISIIIITIGIATASDHLTLNQHTQLHPI